MDDANEREWNSVSRQPKAVLEYRPTRKYRIIKTITFDGEMFSIERQDEGAWRHVTDSTSATLDGVNKKMDYIYTHGEPRSEVVREVEV